MKGYLISNMQSILRAYFEGSISLRNSVKGYLIGLLVQQQWHYFDCESAPVGDGGAIFRDEQI